MYILHTTTKSNTIPFNFTGIIEYSDGSKEWHVDGKRHRFDGPAREWTDGTKSWWVDGIRHRLDGPAIEWADGSKQWFVDGKQVSESEHKELVNKLNKSTCSINEKIVEIDGKKYKMMLVD